MKILIFNNTIRTLRISLLALLSVLIAGCFMPAIVTNANPECQLVTKELKLTFSEEGSGVLLDSALEGMLNSSCNEPECLLIIPLGIFTISVTSMIVSGSIVVVGNTIHWLEKEGKCKNSTTQTMVNFFTGSIKLIGGKVIQSTNDLITWFKQHLVIEYGS
jgi:hypothetical protein